ncbi:hypothetical protein [Paucilactobacillus kaifaensis]|uniref:hypothetical protein n=1 Tax=Paucilactobacillus kaifaensis TaxID=2559921 RepID=UPI0010F94DB6|nr:hypothetical protein [Paucilactobacillus kaifaensis]
MIFKHSLFVGVMSLSLIAPAILVADTSNQQQTVLAAKKAKYIGSKNNVYGHLTSKTKKSGILYKDKDLTYVKYAVGKHKVINVVKEDFRNMPLDPNLDQESISEHIADFMEKDAVKVGSENGNDIYHSNKINKDYRVEEQKNSKGEITFIIISRQDVNE